MRLQTLLSVFFCFAQKEELFVPQGTYLLALNIIKSEYFMNINGVFKIKLQDEWMKNEGKDKLMLASNLRYENLTLLSACLFLLFCLVTRSFHITICSVCLVCKEFWSSGTESKAAFKPQGPFIHTMSSPCLQL